VAADLVEVRPAGPPDLAGVREIAAGYGNLADWPRRPDYLDYELERSGLWVALDADAVVGFAGVLTDGGTAHLADAFVRPDRLGRGIGQALLDAALPRSLTRTTLASSDPRALPLYVRAGLRPLAPVLYLDGSVAGAGAGDQVGPAGVLERDAAGCGRRRPAALAFLERAGAHALVAGDRAYAVVRPAPGAAHIGPAAGDAGELVAFAAAASAEHGAVHLALPGPHPALRPLLAAGLRVGDADTYMGSRPDILDLTRYVPHPDLG
jgi:GNAT superfamily N-acetyltransferase